MTPTRKWARIRPYITPLFANTASHVSHLIS